MIDYPIPKMVYTDSEMIAMYRGCLDPVNQLKIIAELNGHKNTIAIYYALIRGGLSPSQLPDKSLLSEGKSESKSKGKKTKNTTE